MEKETILEIKPEGWIDTLIIESGEFRCGEERSGLHIQVGSKKCGGVLKREDMVRLIEIFTEHLKQFPLSPL